MQKRHHDRDTYFKEQVYTTDKYVIPFMQQTSVVKEGLRVLEIGCGEAGNLKPFLDRNCICTGIDLSEGKIERGKEFYVNHLHADNLTLIAQDIYNITDFVQYDIIFMRDVIEHIHNQERFFVFLRNFMHENTLVFFAFPPWQNPFGGHQQICKNKFLSVFPYFHLFPKSVYRAILKVFGESRQSINGLLEIKETGISIERFERYIRNTNLKIVNVCHYFINPNYEIKFKLRPRKTWAFIGKIPFLRNFVTTCVYYNVMLRENKTQ